VTVTGEEAHGGSPMANRRDALMGAAGLIAAVEEVALATIAPSGEPGRGTVGQVTIYPSSRNITPSRVWFSIDTRHGDPDCLDAMGAALRARAAEIAAARHLSITVEDFWYSPLTPFDARLVQRCRDAAEPGPYHQSMHQRRYWFVCAFSSPRNSAVNASICAPDPLGNCEACSSHSVRYS
jgi:N-carbamoyl-L-amino-acid hydrolase